MRKVVGVSVILLLAMAMAFAQDVTPSSSPSQTDQKKPSQAQTDVGGVTDKDQPLFRGCISGTKDNYILTEEKSGKQYRLHSDKDINEHLNHMVEIRGTIKPEGDVTARSNPPSDLPQTDQPAGSKDKAKKSKAQREIDVADIKTVSEACPAAK